MSKATPAKTAASDISRFCKSSFTLTFAVEVLGIDVWHDCNEGWVDLGPCVQGIKIQYQLYPGQIYDLDILIWPHVAKIWCGSNFGWVRTWQFLERRFLTFTINHIFPVRVTELQGFTATVLPSIGLGSLGANAKNDKNVEVFLPKIKFGERRYFAPIVEGEESLVEFLWKLIWEPVVRHIPTNYMDAQFDVPQPVSDVRHQDAIIYYVKEAILYTNKELGENEPDEKEPKIRDRRESKIGKDKEKEKKKIAEVPKVKFEIKLSGDAILSGIGRIVPFANVGDRPTDLGEIIAVISSSNLPAQDDFPIIFVNVENLTDIPVESFKKLRISKIYTRWIIGQEIHDSEPQNLKSTQSDVKFNDHHALPMDRTVMSDITSMFLDTLFQIELRGIRSPTQNKGTPNFFGYQRGDHDFGITSSNEFTNDDTDILIAVTKIDASSFTKGVNNFLRGEYPLFPPPVNVATLERESSCTNDINLIKAPVTPSIVVPPYVIMQAQMTLEVSLGFVGCQPKNMAKSFSRLYCFLDDADSIMSVLKLITEINEDLLNTNMTDDVLTGFTLDAGNLVIFFVEGPRDGHILRVWEMTGDFYPKAKSLFSTAAKYPSRIYPELLLTAMPFYILKMYVPLGLVLACPPIYARPALPLPARSALLKLGRLISSNMNEFPCTSAMPTAAELKSFILELCVTPKPVSCTQNGDIQPRINGTCT